MAKLLSDQRTATVAPMGRAKKKRSKAEKSRAFAAGLRATGGRYALPGPTIDESLARLLRMLTYKRPAGSATEEDFIATYIDPLEPWIDGFGNRLVQIGDNPNILWSCHTDTVHHVGGRQKTFCVGPMVYAEESNCLGADDTAGVWLCLEMIAAGVEGLYVFHREEECGGNGSQYIAKSSPKVLDGIAYAIALDRKGYDSVITHQFGRCCSEAFADSLAKILGGKFAADCTGLFTDTANYTDLIGECTNLSVGYFQAHGPTEHLDLGFVAELRDTLIGADFSTLMSSREPGESDGFDFDGGAYGGGAYGGYGGAYYGTYKRRAPRDLYDLCADHAGPVSRWMATMGVTAEELAGELGIELEVKESLWRSNH